MAFTFTKKAAAELKDRIHQRCRAEFGTVTGLAEMYVGTIHGYCLELLKSDVPAYMKYEVLNEVQTRLSAAQFRALEVIERDRWPAR